MNYFVQSYPQNFTSHPNNWATLPQWAIRDIQNFNTSSYTHSDLFNCWFTPNETVAFAAGNLHNNIFKKLKPEVDEYKADNYHFIQKKLNLLYNNQQISQFELNTLYKIVDLLRSSPTPDTLSQISQLHQNILDANGTPSAAALSGIAASSAKLDSGIISSVWGRVNADIAGFLIGLSNGVPLPGSIVVGAIFSLLAS